MIICLVGFCDSADALTIMMRNKIVSSAIPYATKVTIPTVKSGWRKVKSIESLPFVGTDTYRTLSAPCVYSTRAQITHGYEDNNC